MRFLDLAFRADQSLSECGFGKEKGFGDFRRGESAESSQRERNLTFAIERGMAAGEDQSQAVVGKVHGFVFEVWLAGRGEGFDLVSDRVFFIANGTVAPDLVDQLAMGGRHQPRGWIGGDSRFRPRGERSGEGFLSCVFGSV